MAVIVVQMGHVPRQTGRTGTWREQELTRKVGKALRTRLIEAEHKAHVMGADDELPVSKGDVFVALHGESGNAAVAGPGKSTRRGASVGFPGGFLPDNHTANLREYYMWDRTGGFKHRYLAEHATLTNSADEEWISRTSRQSSVCSAAMVARSRKAPFTIFPGQVLKIPR